MMSRLCESLCVHKAGYEWVQQKFYFDTGMRGMFAVGYHCLHVQAPVTIAY